MDNNNNDNIILFPKLKVRLKEESMEALKQKDYQVALMKLDQLIQYDESSHEVMVGKLLCLMELNKYVEAESLCEELIKKQDEHYYEYLHMYTTLLFQTSQYQELIDQLDQVFLLGDIPSPFRSQLWQLYEISKKLNLEKKEVQSSQYIEELKQSVRQQDPKLQWRIVEKCKRESISPDFDYIKELLLCHSIEPVVKTALMEWLQEMKLDQVVEIQKFNHTTTVIPEELPTMENHTFTKNLLSHLHEVEQENPSLYELIEKLLYRYIYVRYPIIFEDEDLSTLAKALTILGYQYLQLEYDWQPENRKEKNKLEDYISEILECERHFLTIIEY